MNQNWVNHIACVVFVIWTWLARLVSNVSCFFGFATNRRTSAWSWPSGKNVTFFFSIFYHVFMNIHSLFNASWLSNESASFSQENSDDCSFEALTTQFVSYNANSEQWFLQLDTFSKNQRNRYVSLSREIIGFELPEAILILTQSITWTFRWLSLFMMTNRIIINIVMFCFNYFTLFILELSGNPSFVVSISIWFRWNSITSRHIPHYFIRLIQTHSSFHAMCVIRNVVATSSSSSSSACQFYVRVIWYRLRIIS